MNTNNISYRIILKARKNLTYADRVVIIEDGMLKYFKEDNLNEPRFKADLLDIIFYEKNKQDKKKYYIVLVSKTNSFREVRFKHADSIVLYQFKIQLEKFVNEEKLNRTNKEEIRVIINKEEKVVIKNSEETLIIPGSGFPSEDAKSYRPSAKLSLTQNFKKNNSLEKFKNTIADVEDLSHRQFDNTKYEYIFNYDYKHFIVINNINISSTNNKKLSQIYFKIESQDFHFNKFYNQVESDFACNRSLNSYFYNLFLALCFILGVLNLYSHNLLQLVIVFLVYFYYKFTWRTNNKIQTNNFLKILTNFNSNGKSTDELIFLRSETLIKLNVLTVRDYLLDLKNYKKWNDNISEVIKNEDNISFKYVDGFEKSDIEFMYDHNDIKNKIMIAEISKNDLKNLYVLESNDSLNKVKLTFYSVCNELSEIYINSCVEKLHNFVKFINYDIQNNLFFSSYTYLGINDLQKYLTLDQNTFRAEGSSENEKIFDGVSLMSKATVTRKNNSFTNFLRVEPKFIENLITQFEKEWSMSTKEKLNLIVKSDNYILNLLTDISNYLLFD